jgi:hypothetical protein
MALCGFLAVAIPASILPFGYDEVCLSLVDVAYLYPSDYLRPDVVVHGSR